MKKLITITVAFLAAVCMNAQELCSFNPNNELGLGSNFNYNTTLYAGEVIGKTNSIVCTVGANDMYQSWSYSFSAGNGIIKGGLQGQTNPKDANGELPSRSLLPPVNGAFLRFEAKADGWLSVLLLASSNKAYTVFEDGKAIGYTFGAIGSASSDLGAVYQFAILGEGQNNEVKNPIEFAEQEFLKATAPSKYNARWSWDAEGNKIWDQIKINGRGVIKFHVKKGGNYIVNANGSKIPAAGFCFDTHGNTVIKADGTTILSAGTGFYNKRTIHVATAGTLPNLISNYEKNLIEDLTLTGELNGTDIAFIRRMAGAPIYFFNGHALKREESGATYGILSVLDISGAKIVSGGDCYLDYYVNIDVADDEDEARSIVRYYTKNNVISDYMFTLCKFSKVSLPPNVTSIGSSAFSGCSGLTSVTIPNSVTSIGDYAFKGCSGLTSVTIPNSVTSIGYDAFQGCSGLTSVTIPNSVTSIGSDAFYGCSGLTSVTIGNSVTSIGVSAFSGCRNLTSIQVESGNEKYDSRNNCNAIIETSSNTLIAGCKNTSIPNSVTSIGSSAFSGCSGLTSITIGNSVTSIGDYAFSGCSGLTSVTIPNSVTSIGNNAFKDCSGLTSVTIPNSVTSIGDGAFYGCSGLTSVSIPNSVTSISYGAFYSCSGLTFVSIPNSVTTIGGSAFEDCSGLTFVSIPNSVTSIGSYAFNGCSGLTSVTIPNSVTSIGYQAFWDCTGLTSVTIGNSVTSISYGAFYSCSGLTSIVSLNSNPPSLQGSYAFNNVDKNNCVVWVPKGSLSAYKGADVWKDFANIFELVEGDLNLDDVVDQNDMDALVRFVMGENPEGFYEGLADLNGDNKINAVDVVKMVDLLSASSGLSVDSQLDFDNSVVSSLSCTLNNERSEAIQLTKCELYCNHNLVSYKNFSGASASVQAGGSKECTFNNLAKLNSSTGFTVCWYYTANGKNYAYHCALTD